MNIQVLGICRFSLLVTDGFQKMPGDLDARRRSLYDPARLAVRMAWFEHVFLPSIRAQSDPDFRLVVVTGEDLPVSSLDRLAALVSDAPQIELVLLPPCGHTDGCRDVVRQRIDRSADVVAQFRQDDDDAVATDFVRRVRGDFRDRLRPLFEVQSRLMLDYARGFVLAANGARLPELHAIVSLSWALAQVIYLRPDDDRTVMDFPHKHIFRNMTSVSMVDRVMYVRGVHDWNDSGIGNQRLSDPVPPARAGEWLSNRFGIDLRAVQGALKDADGPER